jgi:LPXTG-motif cell wall-anchored protein
MKMLKLALVLAATAFTAAANAQEMTALSCDDFKPTPEALARFANLKGACEGIVDLNGELYAEFSSIVRRAAGNNVTLYLPATEHTFRFQADPSHRVLIDGRKTRVRDLVRGQEIRIYLSVSQFAKPDIEEVAFFTDEDILVDIEIERVPALPTTASIWPTLAGAGLLLLGIGYALRRRRFRTELPLVIILSAAFVAGPGTAEAETEKVQVPGRVITATVQSAVIVEAVNKETRELKLIDASGQRHTIVADKMVANFDQIEPRDRIVVEYLESVAILVVPAGAPELGDAMAVELAPLGSKPGISGVETVLVKATVESLNLTDRIATLRYEDGSIRTVKVADDVPLDLVKVGDEVRFRITRAIAVSIREADSS